MKSAKQKRVFCFACAAFGGTGLPGRLPISMQMIKLDEKYFIRMAKQRAIRRRGDTELILAAPATDGGKN